MRQSIFLWLAAILMVASTLGPAQTPAKHDPSSRGSSAEARSYVDYSLPELQKAVSTLHGLEPDPSQDQLSLVLTKVGQVAEDILGKTPNLLSHENVEQVFEMEDGTPSNSKALNDSRPREFDYLILFQDDPINSRIKLEEYRTDPQGHPIDPSIGDVRNPRSQGFATTWLLFLPSHGAESRFRYLGKQKIKEHGTFVVAFAQNPGLVQFPAEVAFQGGRIPVFHQGVAWIDEATFRIVRLQTDLLNPIPSIHMERLTARLQFDDMQVSGMTSLLWLPREVEITSKIKHEIFSEVHRYSNYRLYAVSSKIVPATP